MKLKIRHTFNCIIAYLILFSVLTVSSVSADTGVQESITRLYKNITPIYRLYNPNNGEHLYTPNELEYRALAPLGWQQENIAFNTYNYDVRIGNDVAVPWLRVFNPNNGLHHWTTNSDEYEALGVLGWKQEGPTGYIFASEVNGTVPLYRLYNPNNGTHHWTLSSGERNALISFGWIDEGIAGYVIDSINLETEGKYYSLDGEEPFDVNGEQYFHLSANRISFEVKNGLHLASGQSMSLINDAFYENYFSDDLPFYLELIDGLFLPRNGTNSPVKMTENNRFAVVRDAHRFSILTSENLEGQPETINGLASPVEMPAGAIRYTVLDENLEDTYSLFSVASSEGDTEFLAFETLEEILQHRCGEKIFTISKSYQFFGVAFRCGEENEDSGTLVGVKQDGTLVSNIGTWVKGPLPNTTIEAIVTEVNPRYLLPDAPGRDLHTIYVKQPGTSVAVGFKFDKGRKSIDTTYNQIAFDAITTAGSKEYVTKVEENISIPRVKNGKLALLDSSTSGPLIYGYLNTSVGPLDFSITKIEADISLPPLLQSRKTTPGTPSTTYPDPVYVPVPTTTGSPSSTGSEQIGLRHELVSAWSGSRHTIGVYLKRDHADNEDRFWAAKTSYDATGAKIAESTLIGIHNKLPGDEATLSFKMEETLDGWNYSVGGYSEYISKSEYIDSDLVTGAAYFFGSSSGYIRSSEQTTYGYIDNMVYKVDAPAFPAMTVYQNFDHIADGLSPVPNVVFNKVD
jgi:hypothetical protein